MDPLIGAEARLSQPLNATRHTESFVPRPVHHTRRVGGESSRLLRQAVVPVSDPS